MTLKQIRLLQAVVVKEWNRNLLPASSNHWILLVRDRRRAAIIRNDFILKIFVSIAFLNVKHTIFSSFNNHVLLSESFVSEIFCFCSDYSKWLAVC